MPEQRFPYKPNVLVFILCILFFAGCMLVLGNIARTNDRGLVLNGILEFSEGGATLFYWSLAVASGLFIMLGTLVLIAGLTSKKEVVLTADTISAPKSGISKKAITVDYSEITAINIQSVQKQKFLNIFHPGGKLTISQSMLPSKQVFDQIADLMAAKVDEKGPSPKGLV